MKTTQSKMWRTLEPPKGDCVKGVALAQALVLGCEWTHHPQDQAFSGQLSGHIYLLHNPLLKDSNKSHISTSMWPMGKIHLGSLNSHFQ